MEAVLFLFFLLFYSLLHYWLGDNDTAAEKDEKRFAEGLQLVKNKQYEEGLDYFERQITINKKSAVAWLYKGFCNLKLDNYYAAILDLSTSEMLDNALPECYFWKAQSLYHIQEFNQSFKEIDKAVWFYRSENADTYRWRALIRLQLNQKSQAIADLRKAEDLGDEKAAAMLRGYSYMGVS